MKKPSWVIEKERSRKEEAARTVWLFGLHAVRDALLNPRRVKHRLVVTQNAADRLGPEIMSNVPAVEHADPRRFPVSLDPGSVHQGAALEVTPLAWGPLESVVLQGSGRPMVLLLDRVTDPHNAGAILRSAEVFGASAVIAPHRHSAPETGALAKAASGALERQPYLRVANLGRAMDDLRSMGFHFLGLDGTGESTLEDGLKAVGSHPLGLVLGAEGPGLRQKTKSLCDHLVRIDPAGGFGSLNVSNAAAVSLYASRRNRAET